MSSSSWVREQSLRHHRGVNIQTFEASFWKADGLLVLSFTSQGLGRRSSPTEMLFAVFFCEITLITGSREVVSFK